jgi:predicted NBD/HSP70 family sugar kinase
MKPASLKGEVLSERARRNLAILETIRRSGPLSKTDISKSVGLNIVTVSNYIEDFLRQRLIFEKELDVSTGGRRPVLLDLNADAGLAIGIGLNLMDMVGVLTDLDGKVLVRAKRDNPGAPVNQVVDCVLSIIREILEKSAELRDRIKGIGIGIAGIVNKNTGTIRWPEKLSSRGYTYSSIYLPLKDIVEKEFSIPCIVENDATVACFAEQWLVLDHQIENVIYMFSGVGCGLMINHQIYRGATGAAGEVSVFNAKEDGLFNCVAGSPCFIKRWEADLGIVEGARQALKAKGGSQSSSAILEFATGKIEEIRLVNVFQAARQSDQLALDLIRQAGRRLGIKIAFLVNLLNPEIVIIGGGIEEAGNVFFDVVKETVSRWSFEEMAESVKIIPSGLGENSVALGAASLIVRNIFAQL